MKYGLKSVSMDDLSKAMSISKKTLYQYVSNKSELVQNILNDFMEEDKKFAVHAAGNSENAIHELLLIAEHVRNLFSRLSDTTIYDLQKYYPELWKEIEVFNQIHIRQVFTKNILRGKNEGLYRKEIDPLTISILYTAKALAIANLTPDQIPGKNKEAIVSEGLSYHIHGIASDEGIKIFKNYLNSALYK